MPAQLLSVIDDLESELALEQGRHLTVPELARIAPVVRHVMEGYAAQSPSQSIRDWARSSNVAWAVATGDYAGARKLLDDMPYILNGPVTSRGIEPHEIIGNGYALTGPAGPALTAAMAESDAAKRATLLAAAIPTMPGDLGAPGSTERARCESSIAWARRRLAEAQFSAQLDKGDWVTVPLPADLAGWQQNAGDWTVEDGGTSLVGKTNEASDQLGIVAPVQMPARCEMRCTLEYIGANPVHNGLLVCPAWSQAGSYGVYPYERAHEMDIGGYARIYVKSQQPLVVAPDGKIGVHCRYEAGTITALDDADNALVSHTFIDAPTRRIAFMITMPEPHAAWRISHLEARLLK